MTQALTSQEKWDKYFAERGGQTAPPDHPIYSEGPVITFLSRTPEQSGQKAIVSPQKSLDLDSD